MATIVHKNEFPRITYGDSPSAEDSWLVFGTEADAEVVALVLATIPANYGALVLQNYTPEHQGNGVWDVAVRYAERKSDGSTSGGGDMGTGGTVSFETGGGTTHITQALFTRQTKTLAGVAAPDFQGAIGWDGEKVGGVDVTTPVFHWTETRQLPVAAMTLAYFKKLRDLTGKVNLNAFRGFDVEEVLFLGASGSAKDGSQWEVSYKFAAQPTQASLTIGEITGVEKKGWDYLDVQYEVRPDANFRAPRPIVVRVLKLYEQGNFSDLGIGS